MVRKILGLLMLVTCLAGGAFAQVPSLLPFQGRLTDSNGAVIPANTPVTFQIFDAADAGTSVFGPESHTVTPVNGVVSVFLGAGNPAVPITAAAFNGTNRFLQITVNGQVLSPRIRIGTQGFAFMSQTSQTVVDNAITLAKMADNSVGTAEVADNAITLAKMADNSVGAVEIVNEAGVASSSTTVDNPLTITPENLTSRTITAPTAGFIVAMGSANIQMNHVNGTASEANLSISTTSAVHNSLNLRNNRLSNFFTDTGTYRFALSVQEVFNVPAGSQTIHLVASAPFGAGVSAIESSLILLFFPTSYGTVTEPGLVSAPALPVTPVVDQPQR